MVFLLQNVRFEGPLGALVALILGFTAIVGAIKGGQWLWQSFGRKILKRINRARVATCEREMLEFWQDFFDHRRQRLVIILNDKKECIYVSSGAREAWRVSPDLVDGKKWRRLHKDSTLRGYLDVMAEAYETGSPFTYPVIIQPNGEELQYIARGDPYISGGDIRYFVITLDRIENVTSIERKQLEARNQ